MKRWKRAKNLKVVFAVQQIETCPWSATDLTGTIINSRKPLFDHFHSPRFSIRLSLLLAALGISIFFWGLGYKLSLYEHQPTGIQRIPEAKLLSQNEDRNAAEGTKLYLLFAGVYKQDNPGAAFLPLSLVNVAALFVEREYRRFSISRVWCLRMGIIWSANYFRPPPVFCRD